MIGLMTPRTTRILVVKEIQETISQENVYLANREDQGIETTMENVLPLDPLDPKIGEMEAEREVDLEVLELVVMARVPSEAEQEVLRIVAMEESPLEEVTAVVEMEEMVVGIKATLTSLREPHMAPWCLPLSRNSSRSSFPNGMARTAQRSITFGTLDN
jgi:hypothetical protein